MSVSVRMPQLGESVTEGTVTRWLKKEGDLVNADEPLLEVSTDKVDTEIPSPASGVLRGIVVAEEETVEVGAELAVIEEEGAEPAAASPSAAQPSAAQPSGGDQQAGQYPRPTPVPPLAEAPAAPGAARAGRTLRASAVRAGTGRSVISRGDTCGALARAGTVCG